MKIKRLDEISEEGSKEYGLKALYLGKLLKNGFNTPEGFVLPFSTFKNFLKNNNIYEHNASPEIIKTSRLGNDVIDQILKLYNSITISKEIEGISKVDFLSKERSKPSVIIRPSVYSNFSYPGQFKTIPHVKGTNRLLKGIKECWASYFSETVNEYKDIVKEEPKLGVIVQKFVNSSKAGSAFTINPVNGKNELVIEYVEGLGLSLSNGKITPSFFHLDKENLEIKKEKLNKQRWMEVVDLSGKIVRRSVRRNRTKREQIIKVGKIAKELEEFFGKPVYLEWVIKRGNPFITQVQFLEKKENIDEDLESVKPQGYGLSYGRVSGIARRLDRIQEGNILLTDNLSPEISLVLNKISGVISYSGGLGSAGARICREFSIPCIIQDRIEIEEGIQISIDGTKNTVSKREKVEEKREIIDVFGKAEKGLIITTPGEALSPEQIIDDQTKFVNIDLKELAEHSFEGETPLTHPSLIKQVKLLTEFCKERKITTNILIPKYEKEIFEKFSNIGVDYISTKNVRSRKRKNYQRSKEKIREESNNSNTGYTKS